MTDFEVVMSVMLSLLLGMTILDILIGGRK